MKFMLVTRCRSKLPDMLVVAGLFPSRDKYLYNSSHADICHDLGT